MELEFRKAAIEDIDLLTETRIVALRAANRLEDSVDMNEVMKESRKYYETALLDGTHTAYLVFDKETFVGSGGISYDTVMPTFHNHTGRKAYIINMYTNPDYRRMGIALKPLGLLVQDAKRKGIRSITFEATERGRPLYEKFGFVQMSGEMELPETTGVIPVSNKI